LKMEKQTDRFIKVGGVNTRYWAAGNRGSPVVLVHGLGGFIENWAENIAALAQNHRVFALDLLGFGRTDKTPLVRDINSLVEFLGDFMQAVNIEKASLIGCAFGGGLVLRYALDYPAKVNKLILVDSSGMGKEINRDYRFCSLPLFGEVAVRPGRRSSAAIWRQMVYDEKIITPELIGLTTDIMQQPGAKRAYLSALRAVIGFLGQRPQLTRQLVAALPLIQSPALIIWGGNDRIIPVAHAKIAAKIPGARLEIFEWCGHLPPLEYPGKFNKLVLDFLAESV
jgi:pimeloyl-ACP methyl ester carboxylesterase